VRANIDADWREASKDKLNVAERGFQFAEHITRIPSERKAQCVMG